MAGQAHLNITIRGERQTLTVWLHKDGSLVFDMESNDPEAPISGQVAVAAGEFRVLLDRLLGSQKAGE